MQEMARIKCSSEYSRHLFIENIYKVMKLNIGLAPVQIRAYLISVNMLQATIL